MQKNTTIPWYDMMRYSLFILGIPPKDFWQLTMIEFLELMQFKIGQEKSITREQLQGLIREFG